MTKCKPSLDFLCVYSQVDYRIIVSVNETESKGAIKNAVVFLPTLLDTLLQSILLILTLRTGYRSFATNKR